MPKETNACYSCHHDKSLDELQDSLKAWGQIDWGDMDKLSDEMLKEKKSKSN